MGVWYSTREAVKRALDVKNTARNDALVDAAIEAASRGIEGTMQRRFYPEVATRSFDWPDQQYAASWRFWLKGPELISVTTLTSGGDTIASSDYDLRRGDDIGEPPYNRIEIDLSGPAAFSSGDTHQKSLVVTGLWGYRNDETPVGALAEALDSSETAIDVSAACAAAVGVGNILRVENERMTVESKSALDTGQNSSDLTAQANAVTITGITAGTIAVGEIILIDSERMYVVDVSGTTVTVKRQWDGSTLAAHTGSPDIYAYRTLNVTRGALGTTAATHSDTTAIVRFDPPGLISQLCAAEALNDLLQQSSGYARVAGSGDNEREMSGRGLKDIRDRAETFYARRGRVEAI